MEKLLKIFNKFQNNNIKLIEFKLSEIKKLKYKLK